MRVQIATTLENRNLTNIELGKKEDFSTRNEDKASMTWVFLASSLILTAFGKKEGSTHGGVDVVR